MIIIPTEYLFSVDEFNDPKTKDGPEAISILLTRLLLLEPGTIQSIPEAGVGLISKYRYMQAGTENELQGDFQAQIEKYLPRFKGVTVSVKTKDKIVYISATINGILYAFSLDPTTMSINRNYKSLKDL